VTAVECVACVTCPRGHARLAVTAACRGCELCVVGGLPCQRCGAPPSALLPDVNGAGEVESAARVCVECGARA